jgi:hypothetical protein
MNLEIIINMLSVQTVEFAIVILVNVNVSLVTKERAVLVPLALMIAPVMVVVYIFKICHLARFQLMPSLEITSFNSQKPLNTMTGMDQRLEDAIAILSGEMSIALRESVTMALM